MQVLLDAIERIPVATITHVLVALVLGVDLIVQGGLSSDALTYAGIVEGGNVGVGASRGYVAGKKHEARGKAKATGGTQVWSTVNKVAETQSGPDFEITPVPDAPDEPGDPDALPHVSTTTTPIPADQGDAGGTA